MIREPVLTWLAQNVSAHRLQHILGVEQLCRELGHCYRVEPEKAAQAGLLHDLAKFFEPPRLLHMAQAEGIEIDAVCRATPHLLHAEVSAIVARDEFGVQDPEILDAVRHHTLGCPHMSPLSCIVFIADALEPSRGKTAKLEAMRSECRKNLYKSVQQVCDYSIKHLMKSGRLIHPRTILTRNWALQTVKRQPPFKPEATPIMTTSVHLYE